MVIGILALAWLAIGVLWLAGRMRENRMEKSIESFHEEHNVLSRHGYSVAPAHRLDDVATYEESFVATAYGDSVSPRPRLTVVHEDDTRHSVAARTTWEEWDLANRWDDEPAALAPLMTRNRYAAYSHTPTTSAPANPLVDWRAPTYHEDPRPISMRRRRRLILSSLVASCAVLTGFDVVVGMAMMQYLAIATGVGLALYVAAYFFALSQGYLGQGSSSRRRNAPIQVLYDDSNDDPTSYEESQRIDQSDLKEWNRESARYALG